VNRLVVLNGSVNLIAEKRISSVGLSIISRYFMNISDDDEFVAVNLKNSNNRKRNKANWQKNKKKIARYSGEGKSQSV